MARVKRILVQIDENQWAALKGQAAAEGRFVRVLLGEAIAGYLNRPHQQEQRAAYTAAFPVKAPEPPVPSMKELRTLVAGVPAARAAEEPVARPETARERQQRITERQDWLRTHPEEEGQ